MEPWTGCVRLFVGGVSANARGWRRSLSGVVVAVEGAAGGEVADEGDLDSGHADGEGLDAVVRVSEVATVFLSRALSSGAELGAKAPDAVLKVPMQALDFGQEFGASSVEVATRVAPLRHQHHGQNRAYVQGCDEFG